MLDGHRSNTKDKDNNSKNNNHGLTDESQFFRLNFQKFTHFSDVWKPNSKPILFRLPQATTDYPIHLILHKKLKHWGEVKKKKEKGNEKL